MPVFRPAFKSAVTTTLVSVTSGLCGTLDWKKLGPTCSPKVNETLNPSPVPEIGVITTNPVCIVPWPNEIKGITITNKNAHQRSFIRPPASTLHADLQLRLR